ncbi:hypothetical protein [Psychrobacter lutiphocae]|uniref:hypothetical protein n=1 Tax=Psychrobacter lutiphocae TaxID=540500 RepID=UPI00036BE863|nr:hypothetical protein [Psychrobacter lutiphocae]
MHEDYKRNNQYWDIFASETSQKWYKSIGHELAVLKMKWANQDINEGFANFYLELAYFQNVIQKPWVNDVSLQVCSLFPDETYLHTEDGFNIVPKYSTRIKRQDYQNIYMPLEDIGNYYDLRINDLSQRLFSQNTSIYDEALKLNIYNKIQADKRWRNRDIENYPIGDDYFLDDYKGNETYGFEGFVDLKPDDIKQLYVMLADKYLKGFEYNNSISNKGTSFFTKPVNDKFHWIILFPLIPNTFYVARPSLLMAKNTFKKNLKPKDIVFQQDFLAFEGHNSEFSFERALFSQYFYYINRSLERFIDWMEPRLLEVVDTF